MVLFQINAETLPPLEAFPYLGQMSAYNNSNSAAVYLNLRKAWRRWGMVARVLERKGETVQDREEMYKAVAQLVLLYFSKIWVVTGDMLKFLAGFHHWAARRITVMTAKLGAGEEEEYKLFV